jgi:hypothetical protein
MRCDAGREANGMTGLAALEFQPKSRARARAQPKLGGRQCGLRITGTDYRSRTVGYSGVERAARRPVCCGNTQKCYGFADGEASQESDTFTKWKRPSNNRMKLTGSAMAGGAAPAAYPRVRPTTSAWGGGVTVTAIALGLMLATAAPQERTRPISAATEVLAVYAEDWGLDSSGEPGLVAAVWGDGYAVWSEDDLKGGEPFFHGQLAKERVASLLSRLWADGLFADARLAQANFGPDSRFTTILVRTSGKTLKMQSWHERYEAKGRVIATSSGLESLEGTTRLAVLKRQPAEYLYYRTVWSELRTAIQALLPARGTGVLGQASMLHAVLTWGER